MRMHRPRRAGRGRRCVRADHRGLPGRDRPQRRDPRRPPAARTRRRPWLSAIWGPHLVETGERAARWRRASAGGVPRNSRAGLGGRRHAGVRIASGSPGVPRSPAAPDWLAELGGYRPCWPGRAAAGIRQRVALRRAADSHADLPALPAGPVRARGRHARRGDRRLAGRAARETGAPVVVNCSGRTPASSPATRR